MKRIIATLAVSFGLISAASAASYGPLVEPQDLSVSLNSVSPVLLDVRNSGYEEGHVEGAISAPYSLFRGPAENPGQLIDVPSFEVSLEKIGLEQDAPIVIISQGNNNSDFGAAARVYWTLKSTGFTDLTILNGGQDGWVAAGLPIGNQATTLPASELDLEFNRTWYADTAHVAGVVNGSSSAVLADARLTAFYQGDRAHPAASQPGTLPGAVNQPFTQFFDGESSAISSKVDIAELKKTLNVQDGQEVISFCNTGHWAATHWFATSEIAGVENAKLYAGSMVEYSQNDLPMANTPGLIQNLINQLK